MKKRAPNLLFIFALTASLIVFSYLNWCPTVERMVETAPSNIVDVSKEMLRLPEFEIVINFIDKIIDFITP